MEYGGSVFFAKYMRSGRNIFFTQLGKMKGEMLSFQHVLPSLL